MESRFRFLFLTILLGLSGVTFAADDNANQDDKSANQIIQQEPIIQPEIKRHKISDKDIGRDDFEITAFTGLLSIEDFGVGTVYGTRLDYHITEDFFFEGTIGLSTAGTTSYERLSGGVTLLTDDQRKYKYYDIAIGYNLFPGQAYLGRGHAFNSALYLLVGAGGTQFAGDTHSTITIGGGYRINFADWLGMHMDFRDHIFTTDVTGETKKTNNFETTLGLTIVF